ncbi:MAG: propionate CoA-transferase [Clostridiales bacterium]|nr:propionate CoA-transferase [Clostridiales bacterium]
MINRIMDIKEAIALIKDGDTICINAFLAIANPAELNAALTERVLTSGSPKNLTVICSAGYGDWTPGSPCEGYIKAGAVDRVVLGHFSSMPDTCTEITENRIEAYNLPLGVLSHLIRASASRKTSLRSRIGLNIFADPRFGSCGMNEKSKQEWVRLSQDEEGQEILLYKVPKIDIALIKGSSVDMNGNISFEDEAASLDALSIAQAAKVNGGKVIVQVARIIDRHQRPRDVIIPGMMVDAVVLCREQRQLTTVSGYNAALSGDVYVRENEMKAWSAILQENMSKNNTNRSTVHSLIGSRAFSELKEGQVANIGVGIPELVASTALREGMFSKIYLTVESGAIGGLPASGKAFGAVIGADIIMDMAQLFDFYDGGGLDICFIGALEVDGEGNVNGHHSEEKMSGIGGFANITQTSKKVVFCLTFSAIGLVVEETDGNVRIVQEGKCPKFVNKLGNISFSAKNAHANGQEVLYVTERCVFRLADKGLELVEVARGIDLERDILEKLPFKVATRFC